MQLHASYQIGEIPVILKPTRGLSSRGWVAYYSHTLRTARDTMLAHTLQDEFKAILRIAAFLEVLDAQRAIDRRVEQGKTKLVSGAISTVARMPCLIAL